MTVLGRTFDTLSEYLEWLEKEWHSFEEPLYTLPEYLEYGKFVWTEVYCLT
ncbi:MAG: hypothetical protein ACW99F_17200 [Candidatus Hodarchaeales archaeon]|jgi:hypothetical protein